VHVVWSDERDGNYEIYYKRSTNGGSSWGADARRTNDPASSFLPSVSISGTVVHVIWNDNRDGNDELYYKRSTNGGINWGLDTRLTNNFAESYLPSATVSGLFVHVVWNDGRDGNWELYYKRSPDGGLSWGEDTRLTNNSATSYSPSVSVSGLFVHIVWQDYRDGNFEIYYKRSTDGGSSWGADTRLTNNPAVSIRPSISVSGQVVHVVWTDTRDGNYEIYYKRNPNPVAANIKLIIEAFFNTGTFQLNSRDTVTAYLANSSPPFNRIDSSRAVIDSVTYTGSFLFANAPSGTYYIVIKHRNSIETWSKNGGEVYSIGSVLNYDFTTAQSQAFGNNLTLVSSLWCIYSGDVNQDGVVDATDAGAIDNDAFNFITGYVKTDLTGNNFVDASDAAIADNNAFNFVTVVRP
jgi:hypothetical protein